MAIKILHGHAYEGPNGRRSYILLGSFKNRETAKKYAKTKLTGDGYKFIPSSKVGKTKRKGLYYIK